MVRAWLIEEVATLPPKFIPLEEVYKSSGVEYFEIEPENYETDEVLKSLMEKGSLKYLEIVENPSRDELKRHEVEHFHADDELRVVLQGCAYYDIRDKYDEWIRIELLPSDVIVIPGGCYHKFSTDGQEFKGVRVLKNIPYQIHERPHGDHMSCRQEYVKKLYNGFYDHTQENGDPTALA